MLAAGSTFCICLHTAKLQMLESQHSHICLTSSGVHAQRFLCHVPGCACAVELEFLPNPHLAASCSRLVKEYTFEVSITRLQCRLGVLMLCSKPGVCLLLYTAGRRGAMLHAAHCLAPWEGASR